ncbi:hypothetical protein ACC809_37000, partial [Rhizobium johnstonii]
VTLSERHGGHYVTPEAFEVMVREVEVMLGSFDCPEIEVAQTGDFHLMPGMGMAFLAAPKVGVCAIQCFTQFGPEHRFFCASLL